MAEIKVDVADVIKMAFIHAQEDGFRDNIADVDLVEELATKFTELHHETNWEEHESDWETMMEAFYMDRMRKKESGIKDWLN